MDDGDWEQAQRVLSNIPDIKIVKTYHSGYGIINSINGTKPFGKTINALAFGDDQAVYTAIAEARRPNENNLNLRLSRAVPNHTGLVAKTLLSPALMKIQRKQKIFQNEKLSGRVIYNLLAQSRSEEAFNLYKTATEISFLGKRKDKLRLAPDFRYFLIISSHGYVLNYSFKNNNFSSRNMIIPNREGENIYAIKTGSGFILTMRIHMMQFYLARENGKVRFTCDLEDRYLIRLISLNHIEKNHDLHAIQLDSGYMCSHPDYGISFHSPEPQDWERFTLLPYMLRNLEE